jgi:hypothetical protein
MKSYRIRVNQNIYERINAFQEKIMEKEGRKISTSEAIEMMDRMGEINILKKNELKKWDKSIKSIKRKNYNNQTTKKRTNRIIMEIGVPGSLWKSKRASNTDMLFLVITVFILAISGFFVKAVWDNIYDDRLEEGNVFNLSEESATTGVNINRVINNWDYVVPFVLIMGTMIVAALVFMNPIPAAFWFVGALFSILLAGISIWLREMYIDMLASNATFDAMTSTFPITNHIIMNFAAYIIVFFFLMAAIQYGRSRSSTQIV